jgi:16S rRNA C967 or C1407 C5-methylase (RsmB/RsmF family)/NOL1/NOP2/fmu family ribosome biogenesis protein
MHFTQRRKGIHAKAQRNARKGISWLKNLNQISLRTPQQVRGKLLRVFSFASLREAASGRFHNFALLDQSQIQKLPEAFERRMRQSLGPDFESFRQALTTPSPTSIRVNLLKYLPVFEGEGVPWCSTGFYLKERPVFTLDPNLHAGAYYVQEASSMYLGQVVKSSVDLRKPLRVLDLCAAPGGKSTHLLDVIGSDSLLVSNEVIKTRASILSENIQKWGRANVVVTNNDPEDFGHLAGFFDLVVVDAPCSGEGLFRKDEAAIQEWSEENVHLCSLRQRRILSDVWPALKENGVLIYCTCTYNEAENEDNLLWLSQQKDLEVIEKGKRFMPHQVKGEGFFIAAVRKRSREAPKKTKGSSLKHSRNNPDWLRGDFSVLELNELLIAVPSALTDDILQLSPLNIVTRGVAVGTVTRNKVIPEHSLAMSFNLNHEAFPVIDVEKDEALKYLAKETIASRDAERGFALIRYQENYLGFVNRLGNRLNNLYPANWRIRMNIKAP